MKKKTWWFPALLILTAFQLISMVQVLFDQPAENAVLVLDGKGLDTESAIFFGIYILVEWVYFIAMAIARKRSDPAVELAAFFLTGIGLVTVAGANKAQLKTQFIAVMIGAIIGAFNGFWVAKFKLHPFIVTLATQLIIFTVLLLYMQAGSSTGQAISGLTDGYRNFVTGALIRVPIGGGQTAAIPNYVLYSLILAVVMWIIWNKTTFGKNMFALGANEEAARVSGVNVFMTTVLVFALAGAMYGYSGFIESARIASNTANTGANYELDAIAACVIGGVSFVGGIGKISGIITGVLLLRLIFVALPMVGMDQNLQYAIKGGIILIACAIDMRKYLVKK